MPLLGAIPEGPAFFVPHCGALYSVTRSQLSAKERMPDQLRKRAGVFLLLPLFAKQIEYRLSSQEDHGSVQRFGFARTDPCWPSFMRAPATKRDPDRNRGLPLLLATGSEH